MRYVVSPAEVCLEVVARKLAELWLKGFALFLASWIGWMQALRQPAALPDADKGLEIGIRR